MDGCSVGDSARGSSLLRVSSWVEDPEPDDMIRYERECQFFDQMNQLQQAQMNVSFHYYFSNGV